MNLSRLATLAVFFMMVLSAFVAIPTYNVGADDHEMNGNDDDGNDDKNDVATTTTTPKKTKKTV